MTDATLETAEVTLNEIEKARHRLEGIVFDSWILRSRHFDKQADCYCFFKAENTQRSGSIKFRGVFNKMKYLSERTTIRRVITNAPSDLSLAVALSANLMGIPSILVMPEDSSPDVLSAARMYGAQILLYSGKNSPIPVLGEIEITKEDLLMTTAEDLWIAAGEATSMAELMEEIPDLDCVVLPSSEHQILVCAGALARQAKHPTKVYASNWSDEVPKEARAAGVEVLQVNREQLASAQLFFLQQMKILVDISSCAGAATVVLNPRLFAGKKVGLILGSGNANLQDLGNRLRQYRSPTYQRVNDYVVECFSCREKYNASGADFCNCLSYERSLVCSRCFNCFCTAPKQYKQLFWESAPQDLWIRMRKERDQVSIPEANRSPNEVRRPLVLIVEPDKQIQGMAKRIIEDLGYGAVVTSDGESGLILTREYMPDLILTAALMPKMDGREMCRLIKESFATEKTKVAVMTSLYTQQKYRSEAFKRFHVDEYLSKPLKLCDLQSLLQKYLEPRSGDPT